jgi:dienelactone hydrolase
MPASGRYVTPQTTAAAVTVQRGIVYGRATDYRGIEQDLLLDLYLPAPGPHAARPTVLMVHGGSFVGGSRTMYTEAATEYARRGFVVAAIDYRLQDRNLPDEERYEPGVLEGADDTAEAVRFLRSRASTYGIDGSRIALMGSSAGSAIVYGAAVLGDPTPGGPLAAYPADVDAVVGTGGHLTPGLDRLVFPADAAPVMMHHFEVDTNAGNPWHYAYQTCQAFHRAGSTCDFVINPGESHTIGLAAARWWPEIGPFLYHHLRLATL